MLIGLVGFSGSGKGTVADILVNDHDFSKISFADSVKEATSSIFGWSRELLEGDTDRSREFREKIDDFWSARFGYEFTPRLALQLMGTEAGRNVFHKDIWVHTVEKRMKYKQEWEFETDFVIPDVRFPNEIDFIRKSGGFVVRVVRGKEPNWYDDAVKANASGTTDLMCNHCIHYSEWAWIGTQLDYLISNNGTLSMLEADVLHMKKLFTGPVNTDIILDVK